MSTFERNQPLSLRALNAIADRAKGSIANINTNVTSSPMPFGALQGPVPRLIQEVVLLHPWSECGTSLGHAIYWQTDAEGNGGSYYIDTTTTYKLDDPLGKIQWLLAAVESDDGSFVLPAGYLVTIWQPFDTADGHWRPLLAGTYCEETSAESSEEGSEGEGSIEEGSEGSGEGSGGGGSEGGSGGCPCIPVTGAATGFCGYNPNVVQVMGHGADGCWSWIDAEPCTTDSGQTDSGTTGSMLI